MPSFKEYKKAEQYGIKNYFEPEIKKTQKGNWKVFDKWDLRKKRK